MRKARTIGIKADGTEVVLRDFNVPADKQRTEFNNLGGQNWPKDFVEVQYCPGPFRTKYRDKAKVTAQLIKDAEKKAADKLAAFEKLQADAKAKEAAAAKAQAEAAAAENAKLIAAKEASKAAAAAQKKTTK